MSASAPSPIYEALIFKAARVLDVLLAALLVVAFS